MSYSATICYKKIKADEVFPFLVKFKAEIKNNIEEIAKRNTFYSPLVRYPQRLEGMDKWERRKTVGAWANTEVLRCRWFYIPESELLGIFGVDESTYHLFDNISYFQNSCDQDYDYEDWNGIPEFEAIADKWKNTDDAAMKEYYRAEYLEDYSEDDCSGLDYYRKSAAYDEIWSKYGEEYLEDEDKVVYLTLFGAYERSVLHHFARVCEKEYARWEAERAKDE